MNSIVRRMFLVVALAGVGAAGLMPAVASAADEVEGIPVKVIVTDAAGKPIPTAVVREPREADRHRVNTFDGSWGAAELYLPDGTEVKFAKGDILNLEVSAPGYVTRPITYMIRARKNVVPVTLEAMKFDLQSDPDEDDPVIQFGRDKPIDGTGTTPHP